jgi:hypothetical protein
MSKDILKTKSPMISRDREYLFNREQNLELNTYVTWDEVVPAYDQQSTIEGLPNTPTSSVKSIFNKYTTVYKSDEYRIGNNVPLIDTPSIRETIKANSDCSIKNLVACSKNGSLGSETYDYSDFAYCKHLGKIPNNYMITLRRFPIPVNDYINAPGLIESNKWGVNKNFGNPTVKGSYVPPTSLGCMVTWLGAPGNELENILSYSYNMPYQKKKAELQTDQQNPDSNKTQLGSLFATFDPIYQKQVQKGMAGNAAFSLLSGPLKDRIGDPPYTDLLSQRDQNKVYGPIDVIKETYMRDDEGLQFTQSFTLTFEYELRSYSNINAKQAMLDLLANILAVTYTSGDFWGGGHQPFGAHQSDIYTNMRIFKTAGGINEFQDALFHDANTILSKTQSFIKQKGGIVETIKSVANSIGGMIIGGMLNKLGRPQKAFLNTLLTDAPIGLWHVTIGNPFHPIMSIGNMVITSTKITHTGPLGLDDFPTGLKVEVTLDRGKGRDKRDIEKLYLHGLNRIYSQMGDSIEELYKKAPEYKGDSKSQLSTSGDDNINLKDVVEVEDFHKVNESLVKHFGTGYVKSILLASGEISYGSQKKKEPEKTT